MDEENYGEENYGEEQGAIWRRATGTTAKS